MDNESKKLLEILKTQANKSFTSSELSKFGYSKTEAESILIRLEESGAIYVEKTYINGSKSYKLS